jgi:GT2 family glycosyltransferase
MSQQQAEVTIIVIAHSARAQLERCFDSIRRHAGMPVETILVDNASTDDTREWVRAEHPDVTLVELPDNEGDTARNHGLERVKTRYTMFLDSDAALTAGALPAMVAALDEHPEWGLLAPKLVYDDGSLQHNCRRFPPLLLPFLRRPPLSRWFDDSKPVRRYLMADFSYDRIRPVLYAISACHLFRSPIAERAGRFDPRGWGGVSWADGAWCLRLRDIGEEIVFFPGATVFHTYRRTSAREPLSWGAVTQFWSFIEFQWRFRYGRRMSRALDRQWERQTGRSVD